MTVAGADAAGVTGAAGTVDVGGAGVVVVVATDGASATDGVRATDTVVTEVAPDPGVAVSWPDVTPEQATAASTNEGAIARAALTSRRTAGGSGP